MMTACAGHGRADDSKPPIAGPADSALGPAVVPGALSPSAASAASAVLAAYQGYLTYSTLAAQTGDFDSQQLKAYAIDPLLGQWVVNLYSMYQRGVVQRGALVHHGTRVTDVKLSTRGGVPIGTATIVDCIDNSGVSIIDAITRAVVVPATPHRLLSSVATAQMYPDRHWVISQVDAKAVTKC